MDLTATVAAWASRCTYDDIPERVRDKARLQIASVLGAVFAGARSPAHEALRRTAQRWGHASDATIMPSGSKATVHTAAYLNAAASITFDYDDYLFAGHTGHSAVLGSLALGEALGAHGREVLATQIVVNEVAGRLGAAMLLGPHNGQMWAYIHAIAGAVAGARFLGPDEAAMRNAIGIALAQPPYPLAPGFFGPDSKMLLASEPLVAGLRAAELASEGLTGAPDIIGAMLDKIAVKPLPFVFDGLGEAWLTDSLAYKVMPGCAYLDTPVEAMEIVREEFSSKHGRALDPDDVARIRVEATLLTAGMEMMSAPHRDSALLRATDVNFSAALSIALLIVTGGLTVDALLHLEPRAQAVEELAARITVEASDEMNARLSGLADVGIETTHLFDPAYSPTLAGADFTRFEMRFPARVTLETTEGETYQAEVDAPRGAPGRPWSETSAAVAGKFLREARTAGIRHPERALETVLSIDRREVRAAIAAVSAT